MIDKDLILETSDLILNEDIIKQLFDIHFKEFKNDYTNSQYDRIMNNLKKIEFKEKRQ